MPYRVTCAVCGRVVIRDHMRTRYCSKTCASVGRSAVPRAVPPPEWVRQEKAPALEVRPCARCGTLFSPVSRRDPGRYCSVTCRVRAEQEASALA